MLLHHSPTPSGQFGGGADPPPPPPTKDAGSDVKATVHRQLDLDDFANSPAADADDRASDEDDGDEGHDVEMRVAMGESL